MIWRACVIFGASVRLAWFWIRRRTTDEFELHFAKRIRLTFERLGPTFIKLGQMLSLRPDYIPQVYCGELEHLLDSAPPLSFDVVEDIVRCELRCNPSETFSFIDEEPLASASISQVHRATLQTGEDVVIKVLRPGLRTLIARDIRLLQICARLVGNRIGKIDGVYWRQIVKQLHVWLQEEIDYTYEQQNAETMRKILSDIPDIHVPHFYSEHCTSKLLVMERMQGWSLRDLITLKREGRLPALDCDIQERIMYLGDQLFGATLRKGYVHGDVHPANIFLQKDGSIGLVDFGLIQYFDTRLRHHLTTFLIGATFGSPDLLIKAAYNIGTYPEHFTEEHLYAGLSQACDRYRDVPATEMSNGQFLFACIQLCLENGVTLPWSIIIFARSTLGFDGIILKLCPEYIFTKHSRKLFVEIYLRNIYDQLCSTPNVIAMIEDIIACCRNGPESLRTFIDAFQKHVHTT